MTTQAIKKCLCRPLLARTALVAALMVLARPAAGFAARPKSSLGLSFLDSLFSSPTDSSTTQQQERDELKQALLLECRRTDERPSRTIQRERIEDLMERLAPLSPTPAAASSPLLQKNWILEWTTEKEINFFRDWGISGGISQSIDGSVLQNLIEFRRGGFLSVSGILDVPDEKGVRTKFQFHTAVLDLGKWASFQLPPVGEGWFDTIYLDDDLRVDFNSRDDILICTPGQ